jgi:Kef-type K+ transport system membrane component KefB
MGELLPDLALVVTIAWLLGIAAQAAGQPALLAYLVAGFVIGPAGAGWIKEADAINAIAELGLLFLMFMVGLEIDLKKIVASGRAITVTSASQILGGLLIGLGVFAAAGFGFGGGGKWDAVYLAVAAALSSTVIIVKVLYDQRALDTLSGRVTLGVLVMQDLFAIVFLALQPSLDHLQASVLAMSAARVVVLVAAAMAISRYLLPAVFRRVARLPELVLVGAIAWCFGLGELAEQLGLSRAMGALVAGVALSTFPYALDVTAKVTALRDFFVTLFFVGLGLGINRPTGATVGFAACFALFVVLSRVLSTFPALHWMRFGLRQSLLPSIFLCQVSEFSLVIVNLGVRAGHVRQSVLDAVSLAFVALAFGSTVAMIRSDRIVRACIPWLVRRGIKDLPAGHAPGGHGQAHAKAPGVLFLGFIRTASSLLSEIRREAPELLEDLVVVDFNPVVHRRLREQGVRAIYGDISHRETLIHAGVAEARVIVCTISDTLLKGITNERLVRQLRELNPNAKIIAPADALADVGRLRAAGADFVLAGRLAEAGVLLSALRAAHNGGLAEEQAQVETLLSDRTEVFP